MTMGPPFVRPNSLRMNGGIRCGSANERWSKKLRASRAELRRNSKTDPCSDLNGSAVCQAELITDEWRNPVRIRERALVEEIASIEGRIAKKLENRSVFGVGSRPCDDIGKARGAAPDLGWH